MAITATVNEGNSITESINYKEDMATVFLSNEITGTNIVELNSG